MCGLGPTGAQSRHSAWTFLYPDAKSKATTGTIRLSADVSGPFHALTGLQEANSTAQFRFPCTLPQPGSWTVLRSESDSIATTDVAAVPPR